MARNDWREVAAPDFSTAMRGLEMADRSLAGAFDAANRGLDTRNASLTEKQRIELQNRMNPAESPEALEAMIRSGKLYEGLGYLGAADRNVAQTQVDNLLKRETSKLSNTGLQLSNEGKVTENASAEQKLTRDTYDNGRHFEQTNAQEEFNRLFPNYTYLKANDPTAAARMEQDPRFQEIRGRIGYATSREQVSDIDRFASSALNRRVSEDGLLTSSLDRTIRKSDFDYTQTQRAEQETMATLGNSLAMRQMQVSDVMKTPEFLSLSPTAKIQFLTNSKQYLTAYDGVDFEDQISKWESQIQAGGDGTNLAADWSSNQASRPGDFVRKMMGAEGTARNPNSTANGQGQFIEETWANTIYQMDPAKFRELGGKLKANGKVDVEGSSPRLFAARNDTQLAASAISHLFHQNERALTRSGVQPTDAARYGAWFLGSDVAASVWNSPADRPIRAALGERADKIIAKNREVFQGVSTAGQLRARLGNIITYGHSSRNGRAAPTSVTAQREVNRANSAIQADTTRITAAGLSPALVDRFEELGQDPRLDDAVARAEVANKASIFSGQDVETVRRTLESASDRYSGTTASQRAFLIGREMQESPSSARNVRNANTLRRGVELIPGVGGVMRAANAFGILPRTPTVIGDDVQSTRIAGNQQQQFGSAEQGRRTTMAIRDNANNMARITQIRSEISAQTAELERVRARSGDPRAIQAAENKLRELQFTLTRLSEETRRNADLIAPAQ